MKLIGYLTSGYPSIEGSFHLSEQYLEGGCDMLEISLPLVENTERPYLSDLMVQAYEACPDYDKHLEGIRQIAQRHRDCQITILLYNAVALRIGAEKFACFCEENGIRDVNSPDLSDKEVISSLKRHHVRIAGLIRPNFTDRDIEEAKCTDGFVYVVAFVPADYCRPGFETIEKRIALIRSAGVQNPLYCGGGVRTPEHAVQVRDAGADGVFLGTSILKLQGQEKLLVETVRKFRDAIDR